MRIINYTKKEIKLSISQSVLCVLFTLFFATSNLVVLNAQAPVWTTNWPVAAAITGASDIIVKSNLTSANTTTYFVVLSSGATAPNSTQVKAGQNASNTSVASNEKGSTINTLNATEYSITVTGFSYGTTYDVYIVAESSTNVLQASPTKKSVAMPTMPAAQSLPYTQDFSLPAFGTLAATTTYPAGWQGWRLASSPIANPARLNAPISDQIIKFGDATTTGSGCYNFNGKIGAYSTSLDFAICLAVNTTGKSNIKVTFDAMTIRNTYDGTASTGNIHEMALQYRVGTTGDFTILPYLPAAYTNNSTTQISGTDGVNIFTGLNTYLPAVCDNQPVVQIRWANRFISGTTSFRPSFAIDNVSVAVSTLPSPTTYTWNQTGTASWTTAVNWTPTRTTPAYNDILQINGGGTVIITDVPTQTIGQLHIANNTTIELQSATSPVLTIYGETGTDLTLAAGSTLNINQASAIAINLLNGNTANIDGSVTFSGGAHRLTAPDASSIAFKTGATFTAGTSFSGSAFGTTNNSSVVFESGSSYTHIAGSNPFGATAPGTAVVFQTGSNYIHKTSSSPSLADRTYANFTLDYAVGSITSTSSSPVTFGNLTVLAGTMNLGITSTTTLTGTITVKEGALLNLNPASASTMNVLGNIVVENGGKLSNAANSTLNAVNLTLQSSSAGTGTLINNGNLNVSGTTTVQQYLTNQSWYLTSPVWDGANTANPVTPTNLSRIQGYNEGVGTGNDWSASGTTMIPYKGYIITVSDNPKTVAFTGKMNSGNIAIPLTRQAAGTENKYGFNLIGNPYTAYLDWKLVGAANTSKMPTTTMWYRTNVSGSWGFSTVNGAGEKSPANVSDLIPPMQAFWVRASTVGNSTLDLTAAMLAHDNASTNKMKAPAAPTPERTKVRLQVSNSTNTDELLIYTDEQALNGFDMYDSPKMSNNKSEIPEISTIVGGENLVINGLNNLALDSEIPVRFMTLTANTFKLRTNEISNLPEGVKVILKDNGTEFNLTNGEEYSFTSDVTDNTTRFSLLFRSPGISTDLETKLKAQAQVFVNAANQITIIAAEKSNYVIYNAVGQLIDNGVINTKRETRSTKLKTGVYVVKVGNESKRVIIK